MMGETHRVWGAWQGMAVGGALGATQSPAAAVLVSLGWAGLGWASASIPDRVERPLGLKHRGLSHWPEPPMIVGLLALWLAVNAMIPMLWALVITGICNGILSHWTGDFIFGKAHVMKNENGTIRAILRPRGVPYLLGGRYAGLGFKVGSDGEKNFRKFLHLVFPLGVIIMLVASFKYGG